MVDDSHVPDRFEARYLFWDSDDLLIQNSYKPPHGFEVYAGGKWIPADVFEEFIYRARPISAQEAAAIIARKDAEELGKAVA